MSIIWNILSIFLIFSIGMVAMTSTKPTPNEEKRFIKTGQDKPGVWMTEEEIFGLIRNGQGFIDMTNFNHPEIDPSTISAKSVPTELKFQETVRQAIADHLNISRVEDFLINFSVGYHNRYYASETGRSSQLWLLSEVQDTLQRFGGNATVTEVNHPWVQKSIIVKIEGNDPILKEELVIFGAHLDSLNLNGASLQAPGADDNASGSSAVLETLRVIVESGVAFKRSIEFHWYAAEEIGLDGSMNIAVSYLIKHVTVAGMLNMDVIGYYVEGMDDIGIYTDYANTEIAQFLRILTDEYLDVGWRNKTCGYGCSDHASWTAVGYPAVMTSEIVANPQMHTTYDTYGNVNFEMVKEFIKLAIGFVIEMAEPFASTI